jgi:hypothetical protein
MAARAGDIIARRLTYHVENINHFNADKILATAD